MALSLIHLQSDNSEEYGFLSYIVTATKHTFIILSREASVIISSGNVRLQPFQRNQRPCTLVLVRLIFFCFYHKGPFLVEFQERGITISSILKPLYRTLDKPLSWNAHMLSNIVIFQHNNTRRHTASAMKTTLQQFQWEKMDYSPYSPDILLCDFHVFEPLKQAIRGHLTTMDD